MQNIKIFLAEDHELTRRLLRELLVQRGYEVALEASTLEEALSSVVKLKELGINVAILDGNLGKGKQQCQDGHTMARAIKKTKAHVCVIAYSSNSMDLANYGDFYVNKNESIIVVGKLIDSLIANQSLA